MVKYNRRLIQSACLGAGSVASLALAPPPAIAQESGDTVIFLVAFGTQITTGADEDKIIFVGRSDETKSVEGCTGDDTQYPVQSVVIVHPAGERATQLSGLIIVSHAEPIPNGTRLVDISDPFICTDLAGTDYDVYFAKVE